MLSPLVEWGEAWQQRLGFGARPVSLEVYEAFVAAIATSRKVLGDREPKAKDKLISLTDPDVRRNKHGEFYDGYLLDVMMDADSNLICGIDVLAANADEAANAKNLIESEEAAHGNNTDCFSRATWASESFSNRFCGRRWARTFADVADQLPDFAPDQKTGRLVAGV